MFVQRPSTPVRDIVTTMWANDEDGGVQILGCLPLDLAAMNSGPGTKSIGGQHQTGSYPAWLEELKSRVDAP